MGTRNLITDYKSPSKMLKPMDSANLYFCYKKTYELKLLPMCQALTKLPNAQCQYNYHHNAIPINFSKLVPTQTAGQALTKSLKTQYNYQKNKLNRKQFHLKPEGQLNVPASPSQVHPRPKDSYQKRRPVGCCTCHRRKLIQMLGLCIKLSFLCCANICSFTFCQWCDRNDVTNKVSLPKVDLTLQFGLSPIPKITRYLLLKNPMAK